MAVVEGNSPDSAVRDEPPANVEQSEQAGAAAIPEQAVAQMLGYMSDRASRQGGKVLDAGALFAEQVHGQDELVGTETFDAKSDVPAEQLIRAIRDMAMEKGRFGKGPLSIHFVEEIPEEHTDENLAGGWHTPDGTLFVETTNARPDRTLVHEIAHAFAGTDHGDEWQDFYLEALQRTLPDLYDAEKRRVDYKYNKSYLDDED